MQKSGCWVDALEGRVLGRRLGAVVDHEFLILMCPPSVQGVLACRLLQCWLCWEHRFLNLRP
jgi:hypothetical protein